MSVDFELRGQRFTAANGRPEFAIKPFHYRMQAPQVVFAGPGAFVAAAGGYCLGHAAAGSRQVLPAEPVVEWPHLPWVVQPASTEAK